MPHRGPGERHPEESATAWHRKMRGTFIAERLRFDSVLEARIDEMRRAYLEWIGAPGPDFPAPFIGALYKSLRCMGAKQDDKARKFYGVGLRE